MPGIGMSQQWLSNLNRYVQGLAVESARAAEAATGHLHSRVVQRVSETPTWNGLEDGVEVWSEDGQLVIGFHDNEMTSQAWALEYGDEVQPPSPLFRTINAEIASANQVFNEHMMNAGVK